MHLRRGELTRRSHPAGALRNAVVSAHFTIPRHGGARLTLVVGQGRFRASLVLNPGTGPKLALHHGKNRLGLRAVRLATRPGRKVALMLSLGEGAVRARAWRAGAERPGWQVRKSRSSPVPPHRAWIGGQVGGGRVAVPFANATVTTWRARRSLGVYDGMFAHETTRRLFGRYPAVATSYYQPTQDVNVEREKDRIRHGISPNITITSKGTNYVEALGTGPRHPAFDRASRWMNNYIRGLARIARVDPDVPVYATIDHEFKFKVRIGQLTGGSADPKLYGRMLRRFYAAARRASPNLRVTYWMVADAADRRLEYVAGRQFRSPPDAILFDPYASADGATFSSITGADIGWIKKQRWYVGQEIALAEFGMPVSQGDADLGDFYSDLHHAVRRQGLSWAVLFNRVSHFDTQIAGRSDGRRFPAAVSAFGTSLATSSEC